MSEGTDGRLMVIALRSMVRAAVQEGRLRRRRDKRQRHNGKTTGLTGLGCPELLTPPAVSCRLRLVYLGGRRYVIGPGVMVSKGATGALESTDGG